MHWPQRSSKTTPFLSLVHYGTLCMLNPVQLCDHMGCTPPNLHGISQARILEQVAISFSRGSSSSQMGPASLMSLALAGMCFLFVCLFVFLPADPPGTAIFLPSCQLLCLCSKPIISFQKPGLIKQMLQPHSCVSLEPTDTGSRRDRELGRCLVWSPSPSPGPFFALRLPVSPQVRLSQS